MGEKTLNIAKHRINSIFWILHIDENLDNFPYIDFTREKLYQTIDDSKQEEERILNEFHNDMINIGEQLQTWKNEIDPPQQLKRVEYMTRHAC